MLRKIIILLFINYRNSIIRYIKYYICGIKIKRINNKLNIYNYEYVRKICAKCVLGKM